MEGYGRRKQADDRICADLLPLADCLIALPNDLLFSTLPPETPLAQALELADTEMARTALALSSILFAGNVFSTDISTFSAMLKPNALCSIGVGVAPANEENAVEKAIEKMMQSPLLGGPAELQRSDAVVFTVIGGPGLSLGNAKNALELANSQLDKSLERTVLLGAGTAPQWEDFIQITALTVRYTDKAAVKPISPVTGTKTRTTSRGSAMQRKAASAAAADSSFVQQTLELDTIDKGIMENSTPDIFKGEDLDIPTFKRHGIVIDPGK
jgi:cell division GTPase FtsZ